MKIRSSKLCDLQRRESRDPKLHCQRCMHLEVPTPVLLRRGFPILNPRRNKGLLSVEVVTADTQESPG